MKYLQKVLLILFTLTLTAITGSASAEVTYFHHDAQGSTIAATSETGAVLWRESYEPYGERLEKAVSTNDHATYYTGKPHDDRTGLTYFGARHYDPVVGRFMGIDPVGVNPGNVHSFNRYAYANNNPYKYVDPDGNLPFLIPVVIFLAKEVAAEAFERTTGLPALFSVKGIVKAAGKKLGSSAGQKAASQATSSVAQANKAARDAAKSQANAPNRIYSARELKRRAENPRINNAPNPNHNFPESFNAEIFKGNKTIVSDNYHLYTKRGSLNGRSGTYEIGVRPSASGRTEVITHRFFKPDKK